MSRKIYSQTQLYKEIPDLKNIMEQAVDPISCAKLFDVIDNWARTNDLKFFHLFAPRGAESIFVFDTIAYLNPVFTRVGTPVQVVIPSMPEDQKVCAGQIIKVAGDQVDVAYFNPRNREWETSERMKHWDFHDEKEPSHVYWRHVPQDYCIREHLQEGNHHEAPEIVNSTREPEKKRRFKLF